MDTFNENQAIKVLTAVKRLLMQVEEATAQLAVLRDAMPQRP